MALVPFFRLLRSHLCVECNDTVVPRIVPFEFSIGEEPVTSGEPVAVQCGVSEGDMPITFRWSFHGQELSSQMGISTSRINSRMSLLSIDSIAAGHAGNYTCTAQNSAGQANYTAALLVQGPQPFVFVFIFLLNVLALFLLVPFLFLGGAPPRNATADRL